MDLFGRYLFRRAVSLLLLILVSLTAIVWIATALKELSLITSEGQTALTFLKMTALAIPTLVAIIAPVALLITSTHTLDRANGDSELIVMTASGATVWNAARPLIALGLIVAALTFIANLYVLPWSVRTLENFVVQVRTDLISQVLKPGQFSSPEKGLTFHIRDRDRQGRLLGLVMQDERDDNAVAYYLAERAQVVEQDGVSFLIMEDGHIVRNSPNSEDGARIIQYDRYAFDLSEFAPKTEGTTSLKPRARYLGELISPDPNDRYYKRRPGKFRSELHDRFANPLYPIAFVMIAVAFLGQAKTNRQNRTRSIVTAISVAALVRLFGLAATNLLTTEAWAVVLVYGIPVSAIVLAGLQANASMTPSKGSRRMQRLMRGTERAMAPAGKLIRGAGRKQSGTTAT